MENMNFVSIENLIIATTDFIQNHTCMDIDDRYFILRNFID